VSIRAAATKKRQTGFGPAAKSGHHMACRRLLQQHRPKAEVGECPLVRSRWGTSGHQTRL